MTDATQTPPGWYPDESAPGGQRWWDGTAWTEHVAGAAQTYTAFAEEKAPAGTKTGTVWIWIIALTPLVSLLSIFLVDWKQYIDASLTPSTSPYGSLGMYSQPGYLISTLLGWLVYALTVVFAVLDVRELKKRGVPRPFHWAFSFLGAIVYVIGRTVVVRRRTGSGLGPLWVHIAATVVVVIAFIVLMVLIFQYMFATIPFS